MSDRIRAIAEGAAVLGIVASLGFGGLQVWEPVRVGGWSMHPALHPGDVVLVRRGSQVTDGDIALLREPGHHAVLHRIVSVSPGGSLTTKGDANAVADRESAAPESVDGKVVLVLGVGRAVERWRDPSQVRYHDGSTEQRQAMTETTSAPTQTDQGRAP